MTLPIYIAGSSSELSRVRRWADALEADGVRFTHRWFDGAEDWAGHDDRLSAHDQLVTSDRCLMGIRRARLFWLLWPAHMSNGAVFELGNAVGHRWHVGHDAMRVVVSGPGAVRTIFTAQADFRVPSDVDAYEIVVRLARGPRP